MNIPCIFIADMDGNKIRDVYNGNCVEILGAKNSYLYFNDYYDFMGLGSEAQFCALNVNTGEKTNINNVEYDFNTPMRIKGFCDNGLYYQAMYCGDMGPVPLYYSSLDGKINKLISENVVHGTGSINIYNDKLYYTELKCEEGIFYYRVLKSNYDGSNSEILMDWKNSESFNGFIGDSAIFSDFDYKTGKSNYKVVNFSNKDYSKILNNVNYASLIFSENNTKYYYLLSYLDNDSYGICTENRIVKTGLGSSTNMTAVIDGTLYYTGGDCKSIYKERITVSNDIKILLNDKKISFTEPPYIENATTMVPMRVIFEALGAEVNYDNATKTIKANKGSTIIELVTGSVNAKINGRQKKLSVAVTNKNGNTMIPLRFVSEALGAEVIWNGENKIITINLNTSVEENNLNNNTIVSKYKNYDNFYNVNTVPIIKLDGYSANFNNFSKMTIDNYVPQQKQNGSYDVNFNVYNTAYIYGVVEVYDNNNKIINAVPIEKMSDNATDIKGSIVDNIKDLITDIAEGKLFTYKLASGYSKKTEIKDLNIPKGGYIKITNDIKESAFVSILNGFDIAMNTKSFIESANGLNKVNNKELTGKLTQNLLKDTTLEYINNNQNKICEELTEKLSKQIVLTSDGITGYINDISAMFANFDFNDVFNETLKDAGISLGESVFENLAGPFGAALKGIFSMTKFENLTLELVHFNNCINNKSIIIENVNKIDEENKNSYLSQKYYNK